MEEFEPPPRYVVMSGAQRMVQASTLMKVADEFQLLLLQGDDEQVGAAVSGWVRSGLTARVVRGRKMRALDGVFDEFAAAFQFPPYFGENMDAFDECISDLEGLPAGSGYVVVVADPDQVLVDVGDEALRWLVDSLRSAARAWGHPVAVGEWWDRPAIPFHVVLAGAPETLASATGRWSSQRRAR